MLIDAWDFTTFDDALKAELQSVSDLIRNYLDTSRRQYREREASDHMQPYPSNPYASDYVDFVDGLLPSESERTIRAWHYTPLTDLEIT